MYVIATEELATTLHKVYITNHKPSYIVGLISTVTRSLQMKGLWFSILRLYTQLLQACCKHFANLFTKLAILVKTQSYSKQAANIRYS